MLKKKLDTTEDQLYKMLGFDNNEFPFLESKIDEDTDLSVQLYGDNFDIRPGMLVMKKPL